MNHDPEASRVARSTNIEIPAAADLQPNSGTALLAADPAEPIQACPMLEFSFRCTDIVIGKSAYCMEGKEIAIEFYEGEISPMGKRLTMYWVSNGYWYIWANANTKPFSENGG